VYVNIDHFICLPQKSRTRERKYVDMYTTCICATRERKYVDMYTACICATRERKYVDMYTACICALQSCIGLSFYNGEKPVCICIIAIFV